LTSPANYHAISGLQANRENLTNFGFVFDFLHNSYFKIFAPINVQYDTLEMRAETQEIA